MPPVLPKRKHQVGNMSATLEIRDLMENLSTSVGWFDLPCEMREMVIDRMDPKTRCRFAKCSKLCEKEARRSKHYLYKVLVLEEKDPPELHFLFEREEYAYYGGGFLLEFRKLGTDQTLVAYVCGPEKVEKWTKNESGKPKDVRMRYFNEYVEKYKHSIRKFEFSEDDTCVCAYNIQTLKRLEEIQVIGFRMKDRNGIEGGFITIEQLSKLPLLNTYDLRFTFEEFSNFNGEKARFRLRKEEFTQKNILEYLKKRQSGQIHENLRYLQLFCSNKVSLDTDHLMMELDGYRSTDETTGLKAIRFRSDVMEKRFIFRYDDLVEVYFELKWEGTRDYWSTKE